MERRDASGNIPLQHVVVVDQEKGEFTVRSHQDSARFYRVTFGTDTDPAVLPSCECYDWKRNRLPCKHFFAIFTHIPKWSFEKLPGTYRNSPFLVVDELVSHAHQYSIKAEDLPDSQSFDHNTDVLDDSTSTSQPTVLNDLPQKKTNHRTEAARSREILGQIKNLTYVAEGWQDGKLLEKLNRKLEKCYQFLKDSAPKENGITLEVPPPKRLAVKTTTPVNQHPIKSTTYKRLPTAPKKKPCSGRCGAKAMSLKRSYVSSLQDIEGKPAKVSRAERNVLVDGIVGNDIIADDQMVELTATNVPLGKVNAITDNVMESTSPVDDEVVITSCLQTNKPRRRSQFKLGDVDIHTIITGKELTDHIIGIAHSVLHKQFPEAEGLENTTLGPCSNFTTHKGEFSQILHTSKNHWVLVSNIGSTPSSINLYDSMFKGRMTSSVKKQIAALLMEKGPTITVNVPPVQQQANFVDCGVFAIAFLVALLFKQDPLNITFRVCGMRDHLLRCLKQGSFQPFPIAKVKNQQNARPKSVKLSLMCKCRMPWISQDAQNPDIWCAQCESCSEWFHKICVPTMPDEIFTVNTMNWFVQHVSSDQG